MHIPNWNPKQLAGKTYLARTIKIAKRELDKAQHDIPNMDFILELTKELFEYIRER